MSTRELYYLYNIYLFITDTIYRPIPYSEQERTAVAHPNDRRSNSRTARRFVIGYLLSVAIVTMTRKRLSPDIGQWREDMRVHGPILVFGPGRSYSE